MSLLGVLVAKKRVHLWAYERNIIHFGGIIIRGDLAKPATSEALVLAHDVNSDTIVWWRCANWSCFVMHDHQMSIREKLTSDEWRCPNCVKFKPVPNTLSALPGIDARWDWNHNKDSDLYTDKITRGAGISKGIFRFNCRYGHPTDREINWFSSGRMCRFCRGTEPWPGFNTFDLVKDAPVWWDYEKNNAIGISILSVTMSSHTTVWFCCPAFGHSFSGTCKNFKAGNRCPYCAGQKPLAGFNTFELVDEAPLYWHPTKNTIKITEVTRGSTKTKIWLKCPKCPYEWQTCPANFKGGRRCATCGGHNYAPGINTFDTLPGVLKNWNWPRNDANGIKPDQIGKYSKVLIYMNCKHENHVYLTTPKAYADGCGCTECDLKGQSRLAVEWIRAIAKRYNIYIRHKPQDVEFKIPGTRWHADGYIKIGDTEVIFEYHGTFWHGHKDFYNPDEFNVKIGKTFGEAYNGTIARERMITQMGYRLIVIWEHEYKLIRDNVLRGEFNIPELDALLN
ncbi:hypothetical protein PRJ_Dakar_00285 [Faustovirus]|nr:hypothetical protein PRJ_Dakar_00285 [Faustovirus]